MYTLINKNSFSAIVGLTFKIKQIKTVFASSVKCREPPKHKKTPPKSSEAAFFRVRRSFRGAEVVVARFGYLL